jgi:hypothetical protein
MLDTSLKAYLFQMLIKFYSSFFYNLTMNLFNKYFSLYFPYVCYYFNKIYENANAYIDFVHIFEIL